MAIKSKEECMEGLRMCSMGDDKDCDACPYGEYAYYGKEYKGTNCDEEMMKDALEYLSK